MVKMIARLWHGRVPREKSQSYHLYLRETGLKDYQASDGNQGVFLLKRDEGDVAHFYTLSFWTDTEAIKKFAGDNYEQARYYPEDRDYLLEFEPHVQHWEVLEKPDYLGGLG